MQRTHRHLRSSVAIAAMLALWSPHGAQAAALLPPDLDYATVCAPAATTPQAPLDRDWNAWQGEPVALPADELADIATEYLRGSARVAKTPATGLRILRYLEGAHPAGQTRYDWMIGRALVDTGTTAAEWQDAETRLRRALDAGELRAAVDLAQLYGPKGPEAMRSPQKTRELAQTAAAAGDADGKLLFARILAADPNTPPEQKEFAASEAIASTIDEIVNGNCGYLRTVGTLYLQGTMVPEDVPAAIFWMQQAAEAGDALVEERLGNLMASARVENNDFELALSYSQSAADKGRIGAAVTVGQAYAVGLVRPRNLDLARRYFGMAADGGSSDASLWLARIARGDFGGTPDWEAAKRHYRAAIAKGPANQELATEVGGFLIEASSGPDDIAEAKSLLTDAALSGSGLAAVRVAELLIGEARKDPALFGQVRTFLHLGVDMGRPEAARRLAALSVCAGPMFDPAAARYWRERAIGLGVEAMALNEGLDLVGSSDPALKATGIDMVRHAALQGDARSIGYALAELAAPDGALGDDPALRDKLQSFVDRNVDPVFARTVSLARIEFAVARDVSAEMLEASIATLDGYVAGGDIDAMLLKALLLKRRDAPAAELMPLYRPAAERGVTRAMRDLGLTMLDDPQSNIEEARGWLRKAADQGDGKAELRLVDTTADTAMASLQAIGDSGVICSADGMISMARTYAATIDPAALPEAATWLATATELAEGSAADLIRVASAYADGVAGVEAIGKAETLLAEAMQLGSNEAAVKLAEGHLEGTWPDADPDLAHQLLAGLATEGDGAAAAQLLRAISKGDVEAPASEVLKLAQQGQGALDDNGVTFAKLARLDEDGAFGNPDPARRLQWLQQAAEAGDAGAMMRLYRTYANGIGVDASPDLAVAWLQKAAEIGDPRAAKELAAAYTVGFGTTADPERAAFWKARAEQVN